MYDGAGDDGADETDDLFVRPVVRIAAPVPVDSTGQGSECHGKRPRSQVQRLRSSELQSRNSTSPSASPRGTSSSSPRGPAGKGGYLGEGPPLKVAKHSPGSSLRVDVENGIPALGKGASPSPKPISPAPMAACANPPPPVLTATIPTDSPGAMGGVGKRWEATTSRYLAKHSSSSRSPGPSPLASAASEARDPSPNGKPSNAGNSSSGRGHTSRVDDAPSARSRNSARATDGRRPPKTPSGGSSDKHVMPRGSRGGGSASKGWSGGAKSGIRRSQPGESSGSSNGKVVSAGRGGGEVVRALTAGAGRVQQPSAVKPEQLPALVARMRSAAAPEVAAGARGLWGLACAGHLALLADTPSLLDSFALVLASGSTQGRFYALAVAGELAFYNAERSKHIAGHAAFRKGVLRVLQEGQGIEGEAAKVIRNTCANDAPSSVLWASEPNIIRGMVQCAGASHHIRSCIIGAMYAMARCPDAALLLGKARVVEEVLAPCLKDRITSEQGTDIRDRDRAAMACAVMGILCIRDAQKASSEAGVTAPASAQAAGDGASVADGSTADAHGSEANIAMEVSSMTQAHGEKNCGSTAPSEPSGAEVQVVLERRVLVQVVRVLQAAVDSVAYGGVKFSLESALHALPAAVDCAAHVAILCDLGIVELLVAIVKQFTTAAASDMSTDCERGDLAADVSADPLVASNSHVRGTSLRALALSLRVVRCMCSSDLGQGTQGLCVQRLNIVDALTVLTSLQRQLASKSSSGSQTMSDTPAAVPSSPTGAAPPISSIAWAHGRVSALDVLKDVDAVLELLSKAQPLTSP